LSSAASTLSVMSMRGLAQTASCSTMSKPSVMASCLMMRVDFSAMPARSSLVRWFRSSRNSRWRRWNS
jgi:hypothetical protein